MYGSPVLADLLGVGEAEGGGSVRTVTGGSGLGITGTTTKVAAVNCRPRMWKVAVVVVAFLMTAQFSMSLIFSRNYDSLFYVNTTSSASDPPIHSRLQWLSSRLSWMQPVPVTPSSISSSIIHTNSSSTPGDSRTSKEGSGKSLPSESKAESGAKKLYSAKTGKSKGEARTSKPLHEVSTSVPVNSNNNNTSGVGGDSDIGDSVSGGGDIPTVEKPICPPVPPNLVGRMKIERTSPTLDEQERSHTELEPGGHYRPPTCRARHKVAVIIPYRDRVHHLSVFLHHMHPMLQRQQVDYAIFVVEQAGSGKFNRAMLMNVGALEALKQYRFSCFIFHDVDLLPEDDRNLYTCPEQPRHMSIAIDIMKYKLPYNDIFGGVSAMTVDQFRSVNGFSNKFWGWGGEDDDMSNRIKYHGFFISRYPANIGRYTMLSHKKDEPNPRRYQYLHEGKKRFKSDGLTSVKYRTLDIQLRRLYTWVYVDLQPS